ncbi:hypothetical protein [Bacillus velezensis]|uniref:hypothetical protein n=1 Tax=Bacillus velezensis TaxID=492670 RepID=UPI002DC01555|nr:hypothetical protein [Bacillus velezensis]MEC3848644.1 hypothetical protein [Bacillus velezensis]
MNRGAEVSVKIGDYYATDYTDIDGSIETNVIKVTSKTRYINPSIVKAETLWIRNGIVKDLYSNEWVTSLLQRKATNEEIIIFERCREGIPGLKTYGEAVADEVI